MHIHVRSANGEAKFWVEPKVVLGKSFGFNSKELKEIERAIKEHCDEIVKSWKEYFKS